MIDPNPNTPRIWCLKSHGFFTIVKFSSVDLRTNRCPGYALAGDERHRDDIRHLRLWIRHAAHISEAEKEARLEFSTRQ